MIIMTKLRGMKKLAACYGLLPYDCAVQHHRGAHVMDSITWDLLSNVTKDYVCAMMKHAL
jgi:hypothetical protein